MYKTRLLVGYFNKLSCFYRIHKGGRRRICVFFRTAYTAVSSRPHGKMHSIRTATVQTEGLDAILQYHLPTLILFFNDFI